MSGVLSTVVQLIDKGGTHVGVAPDHIIESFRNTMWAGRVIEVKPDERSAQALLITPMETS
ncbi:MAG TPA: hypothetical protein VN844_12140 [Pyrinomonadaceae bacterium]|nr:hypothetical protein [Pyrinomonadaceae bacterium]